MRITLFLCLSNLAGASRSMYEPYCKKSWFVLKCNKKLKSVICSLFLTFIQETRAQRNDCQCPLWPATLLLEKTWCQLHTQTVPNFVRLCLSPNVLLLVCCWHQISDLLIYEYCCENRSLYLFLLGKGLGELTNFIFKLFCFAFELFRTWGL